MIAVALPDIQRTFDVSVTATAWLVTLYLITMAVGQPIGGRLGDSFGRRPVYMTGLLGFGLASLGGVVAPTLVWLIVFRVLQAVFGTLVLPNGIALVREAIPAQRRGLAFGMVGLFASVAAASGPPLGGVLVDLFGWESIFWANVPIVAIAMVLGWRSLPRVRMERDRERGGVFDFGGVVLLGLSLSALIVTPTLLQQDRSGLAAAMAIVVVALGWAFVRWELRVRAPVVDVRLFRRPHFAAACASILLGNTVMYATLLGIPQYLEGVRGDSVRTTGIMLAAMSVFAAFSAPFGGRLTDGHGRWLPAVTGASLILVGTAAVALGMDLDSDGALIAALMVLGLGLGIAGAPIQTAAVESVPERSAGAASGIYSTSRYIGNVLGSSVLAMVLAGHAAHMDAQRFVLLFAGLTVVAVAAVFAHANVAPRQQGSPA
jgi:EmrB/QacA subfamily drug resistance transporter